MKHVRQQIREALATVLNSQPLVGANVFINRTQPVTDSVLPCLIIAVENDESESASMSYPRLANHRLVISIRAFAHANSALDDALDAMCMNVEKALSANISLGGLTKDLQISSTSMALNSEAETNYGEAAMLWSAAYYIQETVPETAL